MKHFHTSSLVCKLSANLYNIGWLIFQQIGVCARYLYIRLGLKSRTKFCFLHCRMSCCWVAKLCPTLCDSMEYSPLGSSVYGISQARILERVAISYSRGSSQPRNWNHISCVSFIGRWILYAEPLGKKRFNSCNDIMDNSKF